MSLPSFAAAPGRRCNAAAKPYLDLTGIELLQRSRETAVSMPEAPTTSSGLRVLRSGGKVLLAAILSFVLNIVIFFSSHAYIVLWSYNISAWIDVAIPVVTLIINLLAAIYFARRQQFSVATGITVGLAVSVLATLAIGYSIMNACFGCTPYG